MALGIAQRTQGGVVAGGFKGQFANGYIAAAGSITLDFGSIGAGATGVATATVTGALTTDLVIATAQRLETSGPTLDEDMVLIQARVSAANTVELRLRNDTAGAIDLISVSFPIILIRT